MFETVVLGFFHGELLNRPPLLLGACPGCCSPVCRPVPTYLWYFWDFTITYTNIYKYLLSREPGQLIMVGSDWRVQQSSTARAEQDADRILFRFVNTFPRIFQGIEKNMLNVVAQARTRSKVQNEGRKQGPIDIQLSCGLLAIHGGT